MKLRNLTPHPLDIHGWTWPMHLPVHGPAPRLAVDRQSLGTHPCIADGLGTVFHLPIVRSTMGEVTGLPEPEPGVVLIVSASVAEACPDRADLAYPGEAIRDKDGRVIGCRGLCAGPGLARVLEAE